MIPVQQTLDPIPIGILLLVLFILGMACYEIGAEVGLWWQSRTPDEKDGPSGILVGALLALLGFLLAVTMTMTSGRYDHRRELVVQEANAIETVYLRAGYLPDPQRGEIRELLRQYVPLRIDTSDDAEHHRRDVASGAVVAELWAHAEVLARDDADSNVLGIFIESLNYVIDLRTENVVAIAHARVPETIIMFLLFGSALTTGMVGYYAGLTAKRGLVGAAVLALTLAGVITLIIDLDRPRDGILNISQEPLIQLERQITTPD